MTEAKISSYDAANAQGIGEPEDERGVLEPLEPRSRRPGGPVARRIASTGDHALDGLIAEIVNLLEGPDLDLIQEVLVTSVRLARQQTPRGELKMISAALKEFAYAFR